MSGIWRLLQTPDDVIYVDGWRMILSGRLHGLWQWLKRKKLNWRVGWLCTPDTRHPEPVNDLSSRFPVRVSFVSQYSNKSNISWKWRCDSVGVRDVMDCVRCECSIRPVLNDRCKMSSYLYVGLIHWSERVPVWYSFTTTTILSSVKTWGSRYNKEKDNRQNRWSYFKV